MALFTVTVANLTRGWSYSYTQGQAADPADPVHLADDLVYRWAYPNELVPSGLHGPTSAQLSLWCRDATAIPDAQVGDLVTIAVRLDTTGPHIAAPPPMTISSADVEVNLPSSDTPDDEHTTLLSLGLVDLTASLPTLRPQPRNSFAQRSNQQLWRPRLAEVAAQIGYSIGCPTWWPDLDGPVGVQGRNMGSDGDGTTWESDAAQLLDGLINTHQPYAITHTLVPCYSPGGYPPGYRWVGPDATTYVAWDGDVKNVWAPGPAIGDPGTARKFLIVPASRLAGGWHSESTIDAGWCELPVKARRAREHVIESVTIAGDERLVASTDGSTGSIAIRKSTRTIGTPSAGAATRSVHAYAFLGDAADSAYYGGIVPDYSSPVAAAIAARFLSDPSTRAAWVYDDFTLYGSRVAEVDREDVLPFLCPRMPGEPDGDGRLLRRFSIGNVAPAALLPDTTIPGGFMVAGQLRVAAGDLRWDFTLTPGDPL